MNRKITWGVHSDNCIYALAKIDELWYCSLGGNPNITKEEVLEGLKDYLKERSITL